MMNIVSKANTSSKRRKDTAQSATTSSDRSESIDFDQYNGCLIVKVETSKPIIPRREEIIAAANVADVLKDLGNEPTAFIKIPEFINSFKNEVTGMFTDILDKFRPPFSIHGRCNEEHSQSVSDETDRQMPSSEHLANAYLEFQSHLQFPIAAEVSEKFFDLTEPVLEDLIQNFLDDLKVNLIQQSRKSLRRIAELQQGSGNVPSLGGLKQADLLYFAEEAEFLGNLSNAKYYIENLLRRYGKTKETLKAAGSLFARLGDREEAVICFKWSLGISSLDIKAMLYLGILLAEMSRLVDAKRILEAAADVEPKATSVWIILGLFYESINDTWNYERTSAMLKQLNASNNDMDEKAAESNSQNPDDTTREYVACSDLINAIDLFFQISAKSLIDRGLARLLLHLRQYRSLYGMDVEEESLATLRLPNEVSRSNRSYINFMRDLSAYHRLTARLILQTSDEITKLSKAESELKSSLQIEPECAENWCLMGLLHCLRMDAKAAAESFEVAMQLETWPVHNHRLIRMKLAQCYMEIENLNELEDSRLALEEANTLNNKDSNVWAYLAMICFKTGKILQAKECLRMIEVLGLTDEAVKTELAQVMSETGASSE
ncbi:hypothetical protein Aperf_G00000044102 [Anoplocephala perfoliata]